MTLILYTKSAASKGSPARDRVVSPVVVRRPPIGRVAQIEDLRFCQRLFMELQDP